MINNIDLTAALKQNKADSSKKSYGFPSAAMEKSTSFGDTLRNAVKTINREEPQREASSPVKKELVAKAEEKLKSSSKPLKKNSVNIETVEEDKKTVIEKPEKTIEQILAALEGMVNQLSQNEASPEKSVELLKNIKAALVELSALQAKGTESGTEVMQKKTSELAAVLEEMLGQLKTDPDMKVIKTTDFEETLKTLISQISEEAKEPTETPVKNASESTPKVKNEVKIENAETANTEIKKETVVQDTNKKEASIVNKTSAEQDESKDAEMKTVSENSEVKPVSNVTQKTTEAETETDDTEDIKSALDNKVQKVNVQGKEDNKQNADAEENKKSADKAPQKVNATVHKLSGEELNAIKLNQQTADNQVEIVTKQVAAPRAEVLNKADVINQIVKKAEVSFTDAQPEIKMQLEPENLGKLTLKLAVEKGLITAKFVTESYEVKQIIESNFNELKDMLQEKGLEVQNFSVSVGQDNKDYNNGNAFQQWKETVRLNGRSVGRANYGGYEDTTEIAASRPVNPYNIHNGRFDHRA